MINTNNANAYSFNTYKISSKANASSNQPESLDNKDKSELRDEFVVENKKNGLFEKFYNFCKNKTGLGLGSKKVEQKITEYENGNTSEEDVRNKLSDYKASQKNAEQHFGDFASAMVTIPVYFKLSNFTKKLNARIETKSYNKTLKLIDLFTNDLPKELTKFVKDPKELEKELTKLKKDPEEIKKALIEQNKINKLNKQLKQMSLPEIQKFINSNKAKVAILPVLLLLGGITKWSILKLNRIGSKEFKVENKEQLDKKEFKKAKKELNHKRHKENFKNFWTGALNGLLAPITAVAGGAVGVPAYILSTSGIRFLTNKNDDKPKSLNNYFTNLINNIGLNSLFTLALTVPLAIKASHSATLSKNLEKVVKNLKDVKLQKPELGPIKTAYEELEDIMLNSPNIKNIMSNNANLDESINKLTDENIFAVKFLQISNRGGELSSKLIENCPPSRSMSDAQAEINKLLNSDKYTVSKLLGVGTVAECYLAKDQSGKEVCIKILKKGINAEKIQKDKEAFIKLVNNTSQEQTSKQYLIKNIDNHADALLKEVDFENEMKAADKLRKSTKKAKVVVPIEAKPGIYVMEKAPGISLNTLAKYYEYETAIKFKKLGFPGLEEIPVYEKKIKELKDKSPDFKDFDLSQKDIETLLNKYIEVLVEQLTKVDKTGKTLHADIHPGNIFIDLNKLNNKKDELYTLLDTGNTIDLTREQAAASVKLTSYIKKGNIKDITKYVLDGAVLPKGKTKEEATQFVEGWLTKILFDNKTKINTMDAEELFKLTDKILRKGEIIPNEAQLNLNKARKSAENSLDKLQDSFLMKNFIDLNIDDPNTSKIKPSQLLIMGAKLKLIKPKYGFAKTAQESKNLRQMSPKEIINYLINPNNEKMNKEKYLTYQFKQDIDRDFSNKKKKLGNKA